jgi:hypothetical protein
MKWDDMTPAERQEYINQDKVYLRETRETDIDSFTIDGTSELSSLADLMHGCPTEADFEAIDALTPLQKKSMAMFYVNGMAMIDIAGRLVTVLMCDGEAVSIQRTTLNQVRWAIDTGRKTLLNCFQFTEKSTNSEQSINNK